MEFEKVTNINEDGDHTQLMRFQAAHGTAGSAANLAGAAMADSAELQKLAALSAARDPASGVLRAIPGNRFVIMGKWANPVFSPGQFSGISLAQLPESAFDFAPYVVALKGNFNPQGFTQRNVLGSIVVPEPSGQLVRINLWELPVVGQKPYAITERAELLHQGQPTGLFLQNMFHADMNRLDSTGWIGYFGPEPLREKSLAVAELGSPFDFSDEILASQGYVVREVDYIDPQTQRPTVEALRRYGLEHATQIPGSFFESLNGNTWTYEVSADGGLSAYAVRDGSGGVRVMYELRNGVLVPETSLGRGSGVALNSLLTSEKVDLRVPLVPDQEYYGSGAVVFKRMNDGTLAYYDRYSLGASLVEGKNSGIIVEDRLELQSKGGDKVSAHITALSMKHHDGIDARGVDVYAVIGETHASKIFAGSFGDLGLGIFAAAHRALAAR